MSAGERIQMGRQWAEAIVRGGSKAWQWRTMNARWPEMGSVCCGTLHLRR